jgi:uncharacterized SAM-binding protein YcdF (DUF218 family)
MIYIIKAIASLLLPPGIIIIVLAVCVVKLYKRKAKQTGVLVAITTFLYLLSCGYVSDLLMHSLEHRYLPKASTEADVIIVLGGGATSDTPNVNGQGHLSGSAASRLITGILLHRNNGAPIIVSGGQVFAHSGSEALIMERTAVGLGVKKQDIIVESESLNTRQNAEKVKQILSEKGYKNPVLVTSAFHMSRAVENFRKQGIQASPYPTDYQTNIKSVFTWQKLLPSEGALWMSCIALREYLGLIGTLIL